MEKVYNNLEKFEFVGSNYKPKDEFVVYRDIDDMARVFVTKKTLKRFNIIQPVFSLTLDSGLEIFEISPRDVVFMIEHTNNASSPYTMRYQNIDFKNEEYLNFLLDESYKNKSNYVFIVNNIVLPEITQ